MLQAELRIARALEIPLLTLSLIPIMDGCLQKPRAIDILYLAFALKLCVETLLQRGRLIIVIS